MKKLLQSMTGGYASSACVVDGTLVLTLPDAISPVVWRMDLGQAKASALEVRDNGDKTYSLVLKTPRGDVNEIAPFAQRQQAIKALMAVSHAMEHAHGQTRPVSVAAANDAGGRKKGRVMTSIVAVLLLLFLILIFINMGPQVLPVTDTAATGAAVTGEAQPGTPVSADDFLRGR